jgi:hypothetical protein
MAQPNPIEAGGAARGAPAAPAGGRAPGARTYREYYGDKRGNIPPPDRGAGYLAGYRFT